LAALVLGAGAYVFGLRGRAHLVFAAACLAAGAPMAPDLFAAAAQSTSAEAHAGDPRLTVLTMNVWYANRDLRAAEALVRSERPDIIILQEARGPWARFSERVADEYGHAAFCMRQYWCPTIILSRLAFIEDITPDDYHLAAARLRLPDRLGGGPVEIVGVHMPWPRPAPPQRAAFRRLADLAAQLDPDHAIVAGDFNSTPWSANLAWLDAHIPFPRRTRAFFTFPTPAHAFGREFHAPLPFLPIDHVYAGAKWRVVSVRRGPPIGSDHYPVIAVLAAAPAPGPVPTPPPALRGFSPDAPEARP
jgi:endonuclease/exonuclease/phosphatase (EEP) superfamily protein YafD